MNQNSTIFSQLTSFLPKKEFDKCVINYGGNYNVKKFTCWEQFLCMMFAQLTYRESLRDIEVCLRAMGKKLYHSGIRSKVSRSTLAVANENRDWRIYADFASILIAEACELYKNEKFGINLKETVYALDSSIVDLCLSVFPWAQFRKSKAGIKLHTLLDLRGNIPVFIDITEAKCPDMNILDKLTLEPGAIYIMDKGYIDCRRLYKFNAANAWFVTRIKRNMPYKRLYSHSVDKSLGLRCDQTIMFSGQLASVDYPIKLRLVKYYDSESKKTFKFISNNFNPSAIEIADLYRCRWQIELFFKWIKQHLRIKAFYGTSSNAVRSQIWIAISAYLTVAIVKKRLKIENSLYTILQILSLSLFEKMPILQAISEYDYTFETSCMDKQLNLL